MSATTTRLRVRQSFGTRFDQCPLSAKLSEEHPVTTGPQARGTIAHAFVASYVGECMASSQPLLSPDRAKDLMSEVIANAGLPVSAGEYEALMAMAWKFATERVINPAKVVDLEEEYELALNGATLTGRPDCVEIDGDTATVYEWKSSWLLLAQEQAEMAPQLRWYAVLIAAAYPQIQTFRMLLCNLRWGVDREVVMTRHDVADAERYLKVLVKRVAASREQDAWPASPGSWCAICAAPQRCPVPAEDRSAGEITNAEEAGIVAHGLVVVDEQVKRRKKALRAWAAEHGPQTVGDKEWGFVEKADSYSVIDRDALREAMGHAGLVFDEHFAKRHGSTVFGCHKRKGNQ